jgi:hypothetical protein
MRRSALALWTAKNMLKVYIARYELAPPSDSLRCLRIFNHKERVMGSVVEEIQEDIHYLLVCLCRHAPETEALATYTPTPSEAFRAIHRRIAFVENIAPATAVVPLGAKAEASSTEEHVLAQGVVSQHGRCRLDLLSRFLYLDL